MLFLDEESLSLYKESFLLPRDRTLVTKINSTKHRPMWRVWHYMKHRLTVAERKEGWENLLLKRLGWKSIKWGKMLG